MGPLGRRIHTWYFAGSMARIGGMGQGAAAVHSGSRSGFHSVRARAPLWRHKRRIWWRGLVHLDAYYSPRRAFCDPVVARHQIKRDDPFSYFWSRKAQSVDKEASMSELDPSPIMQVGMGFFASKTLSTLDSLPSSLSGR